jgi:hypothetical protein
MCKFQIGSLLSIRNAITIRRIFGNPKMRANLSCVLGAWFGPDPFIRSQISSTIVFCAAFE